MASQKRVQNHLLQVVQLWPQKWIKQPLFWRKNKERNISITGGWKSDAMPRRYKQKANIKNNKAIAAFSME